MIYIPKELRINQRIRVDEVRLIGPDGEQMGIVGINDALEKAEEYGLDLVEVAPQTVPPVCRIMNYSKYKYEQEKKAREAKVHQRTIHIKEIRIKPNIEEHDYQVKLYHLKRFLTRGDKVKLALIFRGREMSHIDIGKKLMDRIICDLKDIAEIEKGPTIEGKSMLVYFMPRQLPPAKKGLEDDAKAKEQ